MATDKPSAACGQEFNAFDGRQKCGRMKGHLGAHTRDPLPRERAVMEAGAKATADAREAAAELRSAASVRVSEALDHGGLVLSDPAWNGRGYAPERNVLRLLGDIPIDDGCWPWPGPISGNGYGTFSVRVGPSERKSITAHRAVYEILVGRVAPEVELDHLCRNRACVRPDHLEPVTASENQARAKRRDRCVRGHDMHDPENVYVKGNERRCRACHRIRLAEHRARRRVG